MHRCPVCAKSFPSPYKLQRHHVIHTGQKPFNCTICGKSFTQFGHLKAHLQVHLSRLSTDHLQDGVLTYTQQGEWDKPAAGLNTQGSSNYTLRPPKKSSSVAYNIFLPTSETGNPPKNMPHATDASVTQNSVKKKTLKHQCPKCSKTFCTPSKLQRHFLIHMGQKPYSCKICSKAFRQMVHLKSHLSTSRHCSLAAGIERKKQKFSNRQTSGLQPQSSIQQQPTSHRTSMNSSAELELQCKISGNAVQELKKANIKSEIVVKQEQPLNISNECRSICLKSDEKVHRYLKHETRQDLKPFQSVMCSRPFQLKVNLIDHHKFHRNQNKLVSPATVNSNDVKMSDSEALTHLPEPRHTDPIDLDIIVKPDTRSGNHNNHNDSLTRDSESTASAEKPRETGHGNSKRQKMNPLHQCHTCFKCFPSASKLQRHMMIHTGQRPFGCEICGKRFRQKTHLRVHCRTHLWSRYHKQRSLYISRPPSCIRGFNTRTAAGDQVQEKDLETHTGSDVVTVKHLDQPRSMEIIQTDNRQTHNMLFPVSKKNEVVQKVSKVPVKRTHISKSMQNSGNMQHKCFQCLKCFPNASKLQRHEMVHTGLKPFQCDLCGKTFRQAPHLKTHEKIHCKRKPSKPVNQQGNIRKANTEQRPQPKISLRIQQQKKTVNTTLSKSDGAEENEVTKHDTSITNVNCLFKTNSESYVTYKKSKPHTCRICFKNFVCPYKLSRHLVIHSGIRPYKCILCSKTFTQRGHLKYHEHRCRQGSHYIQGGKQNANHLLDTCIENLSDCTDLNVNATTEQLKSVYTEALAVPEVSLQEEQNELQKKRDSYNQARDRYRYSCSSELAFEMDKLVQNQNMAASPLSHQCGGNTHLEVPCEQGAAAISDSNKLLSDELVSSVGENPMQSDDYWCEPLNIFECDKCTDWFKSENNLKKHICPNNQPKRTKSAHKNCCDICFKHFVTPSKLKRHYIIHTGQRPFSCDICGKMFTQSAHLRTHQQTH